MIVVDASVVLTALLGSTFLVTGDARLSRAPGLGCSVEVLTD